MSVALTEDWRVWCAECVSIVIAGSTLQCFCEFLASKEECCTEPKKQSAAAGNAPIGPVAPVLVVCREYWGRAQLQSEVQFRESQGALTTSRQLHL